MMQTPPKFFITHSHDDNKFARQLCDDLRARGLEGFFDVYALRAGDDIAARIARGLEECDVYIPVLSAAALKSPWCELEINAAINLSMQRKRQGRPRIIPVIAQDCEVPTLLGHRLYINSAGRYDAALRELLVGLGVPDAIVPPPPAATTKPTPNDAIFPVPPQWKNRLVSMGGLVTIGVIVLVIFGSVFSVLQPTPTIVAVAPVATPTSVTVVAPTESLVFVGATPCNSIVHFSEIWKSHPQLGCLTSSATSYVGYQNFKNGYMIWRKEPSKMFAVFGGGVWESRPDPAEFTPCDEVIANGELGPVMGFGTLWCQYWKDKLGSPLDRGQEIPITPVEDYQEGTVIDMGKLGTFIIYFNGKWELVR